MERIGGGSGAKRDLGYTIEGDFETINTSMECINLLLADYKHLVSPKVYINNLGSYKTLQQYNKELEGYFTKHS